MKIFFRHLITVGLAINLTAAAAVKQSPKVNMEEGWRHSSLKPGSFESQLSSGAESVLTRAVPNSESVVSVFIYHQVSANPSIRVQDEASWHKHILNSKSENKIKINKERVFQFQGKWRYYVEYENLEGTRLHSAVLAVLIDGELYLLNFAVAKPTFDAEISWVRELYQTVDLSS